MYRQSLRIATSSLARSANNQTAPGRRFLTTAPPHKTSRSWKNAAVRWGLAGGLVYYYTTSQVFAEEPACASTVSLTNVDNCDADAIPDAIHAPPELPSESSDPYPTLDTIASERRAQAQAQRAAASTSSHEATVDAPDAAGAAPGSPEELEAEASQQGAFNEETGEINWDCPCLGGMADGPCGEQFKAAFSCFVYSKEEPKGVDCIEHFKNMQNCFREHPDVYGAELEDDEQASVDGEMVPADAHATAAKGQGTPEGGESTKPPASQKAEPAQMPRLSDMDSPQHGGGEKVRVQQDHTTNDLAGREERTKRAEAATEQVRRDFGGGKPESDNVVPKAAHDAR